MKSHVSQHDTVPSTTLRISLSGFRSVQFELFATGLCFAWVSFSVFGKREQRLFISAENKGGDLSQKVFCFVFF